MKLSPLLCTDFYKADHRTQYPDGTEFVYSNLTPRSDPERMGATKFVPSPGNTYVKPLGEKDE